MKQFSKIAIILILVVLLFSLTACKDEEKEIIPYNKLFVQNTTMTPFENAELIASLGTGVEPYYSVSGSSKNYDNTYIAAYGLFVVQKTTEINGETFKVYGFYSTEKKALLTEIKYAEFEVYQGMIALRTPDGKCSLIKVNGEVIFGEEDGYVASSLNYCFYPISKKYIATKASGGMFFNICDTTGKFLRDEGGNLYKFAGDFREYVKAYDDYLIRVDAATSSTPKKISFINLNSITVENGIAVPYQTFSGSTISSNINAFYVGAGKFYCYDMYKGDKDGYIFKAPDGTHFKAIHWSFDASKNIKTDLPLNFLFTSVINEYNSEDLETSVDIESYIERGYSFVSAGYFIENKIGSTDQFLIDSDLNILLSMTSKLGTNTIYDQKNEEFREVFLTYVGGIGFNSTSVGDLLLYDTNGNIVLKKEGIYKNVIYNNGVVTAQVAYELGKDNIVYYYGAWTLDGTPIFDAYSRKYEKMTCYIGNFALVEMTNANGIRTCFLVDKKGYHHEITSGIATAGTSYIYKPGCYTTKTTVNKTTVFGVKSFDNKVLIAEDKEMLIMAKYGLNDVVVYTKKNGFWDLYVLK